MKIIINGQDYQIQGGKMSYTNLAAIVGYHELDRPTIIFDNKGFRGTLYYGDSVMLSDGMEITISNRGVL